MSDIPDNNISLNQEKENLSSIITFRNFLPYDIADQLITKITSELLPKLQDINPDISFNPIFNDQKELTKIDLMENISEAFKDEIVQKIRRYINNIFEADRAKNEDDFDFSSFELKGFTELLGTYRIPVLKSYIPILVCIFTATLLSWMTQYLFLIPNELEINAAIIDSEESSIWGIILNGLIPVLMSAVMITIIWLAIKKYGLKVFKYVMGVIVIFYNWYGITFYIPIISAIVWTWMGQEEASISFFIILSRVLIWGSLVFFIWVGFKFFKNKLNDKQKNLLVLMFGIFLGSIIGIAFPMWTTISFAIFLSIWDLITVFKGPLGKIADQIMDNRKAYHDKIEKLIAEGKMSIEKAEEMGYLGSIQDEEYSNLKLKDYIKDIQIEIGSGDLILYSALVAHVFINTLNLLVTSMTIIGVLLGMVGTLYYLFKKKRVLPALPFSMFLGIIFYLSFGFGLGIL